MSARNRSRTAPEDSDDDEESFDSTTVDGNEEFVNTPDEHGRRTRDSSEMQEPSDQASKRRRVSEDEFVAINETSNENGDVNDQNGSDSNQDDEQPHQQRRSRNAARQSANRVHPLVRRPNGNKLSTSSSAGHRPGQIVRISLQNFVIYTSATFHPGPALNMVIGPNGTGKSTVVCAICLGLGWSPNLLGRAKEVSEFVKKDSDSFTIEIELQGEPGKRNAVVKRFFQKHGAKNTFYINDREVRARDVHALNRQFNIQVDNLCQFLPQDRVVEFANLTRVELLTSTQKATAPAYMSEWHEQLKALRSDQMKAEADTTRQKLNLQTMEKRQEQQRVDVERMRERQDVVKRAELLQKARPLARYVEFKRLRNEANERGKAAETALKALKEENGPTIEDLKTRQKYHADVEASVVNQKRLKERMENSLKECVKKREEYDSKITALQHDREDEKKRWQSQRQDAERLRRSLETLKTQKDKGCIEFEPAEYNEQIRDRKRELNQLETQVHENRENHGGIRAQLEIHQETISNAREQLETLRSQEGQQENKLRALVPDTFRAWQWVQENRDRFRGEVYGPPIVSCSVTDPRYVNMVEAVLQKSEFVCFVCTEIEDYNKMRHQFNNVMKLRGITLRQSAVALDDPLNKPPMSRADLESLGFDGWVLNYIKGPGPVLSVLCAEARIHQTAVTLREINETQFEKLENSPISSWVTPKEFYRIVRRKEYGAAGVSTNIREVRPARNWTNQPVDSDTESRLKEEIINAQEAIEALKEELGPIDEHYRQLVERREECQTARDALQAEKEEKQQAVTVFNDLDRKIQNAQLQLDGLSSNETEYLARLGDIDTKADEAFLARAQTTIDASLKVDQIVKLDRAVLTARVAAITAQSDYDTVSERNETLQRAIIEKTSEIRETRAESDRLRNEVKKAKEEGMAIVDEDGDVAEFWRTYSAEAEQPQTNEQGEEVVKGISIDSLEADIESAKARVGLLAEGNPHTITQFEQRAQSIEKLKSQLITLEAQLTKYAADIKEIRTKWEPELDDIVERISRSFGSCMARIGCVGEVKVFKAPGTSSAYADNDQQNGNDHDGEGEGNGEATTTVHDSDFHNWEVHVLVKFREAENLSLLDAHRQSGGERAVSTMFYLMALQSLSRAPFRVVDEINQGMDPRNERVVHEMLVDLACGMDSDRENNNDDAEIDESHLSLANVMQQSQYFLITPKLLPNLHYAPGMKVHCIVSGEFVPSSTGALEDEINFAEIARAARKERDRRRSVRMSAVGTSTDASAVGVRVVDGLGA